jgi:ABC-type dipeptide/oligopeptide/nickel transport system permease subunit
MLVTFTPHLARTLSSLAVYAWKWAAALATFRIPGAIFAEAALSYLGIGVIPPTPSWGSMINEGQQAIFFAPTQVIFPGLAIAITMLAFTFLGDGLRDALDPRGKRGT